MKILAVKAQDALAASGGYAQAMDIVGAQRLLNVSGQIPVAAGGAVPPDSRIGLSILYFNDLIGCFV